MINNQKLETDHDKQLEKQKYGSFGWNDLLVGGAIAVPLGLSLFGLGGGSDDQSKVEPPPLPPLQPFNTPSMLHNVNSAYRL